jgi:hypothetical protein
MFLVRNHQNGSRKVDLNALPTENLKESAAGTKSDLIDCSKLMLDYVTAVISRQSENGPEYFLVQRPDTGLLAGLWDFPNIPLDDPETEESLAQDVLLEHLTSLGLPTLGILVKKGSSLHIFTHIRRKSLVYAVQVTGPPTKAEVGKWVTEEEIVDMAVSELGRKVLRLALGTEKRKAEEKVKMKCRKVVKLEKGQTKLSFGR